MYTNQANYSLSWPTGQENEKDMHNHRTQGEKNPFPTEECWKNCKRHE